MRDSEEGYASYIGIEGTSKVTVDEIVKFIKAEAEHIKDESPNERNFC
jgi:hypothetical protein